MAPGLGGATQDLLGCSSFWGAVGTKSGEELFFHKHQQGSSRLIVFSSFSCISLAEGLTPTPSWAGSWTRQTALQVF